jgi:hypothetical protein
MKRKITRKTESVKKYPNGPKFFLLNQVLTNKNLKK